MNARQFVSRLGEQLSGCIVSLALEDEAWDAHSTD